MIIELIKNNWDKKLATKENKVSVCKAITWHILGTLDTMVISYFLTGNIKVAFSIGSFEVFTKMVLYFIHEKVWAKWTR